jgi:hypothetical protein
VIVYPDYFSGQQPNWDYKLATAYRTYFIPSPDTFRDKVARRWDAFLDRSAFDERPWYVRPYIRPIVRLINRVVF